MAQGQEVTVDSVVIRAGASVTVQGEAVTRKIAKRPLDLRRLDETERLALWFLSMGVAGGALMSELEDPRAASGVILALALAYWLRTL